MGGGKALQKTSGSRRKNAKLNDELYDVKVEASAKRYQVWAHFKALNKAVLVAPPNKNLTPSMLIGYNLQYKNLQNCESFFGNFFWRF